MRKIIVACDRNRNVCLTVLESEVDNSFTVTDKQSVPADDEGTIAALQALFGHYVMFAIMGAGAFEVGDELSNRIPGSSNIVVVDVTNAQPDPDTEARFYRRITPGDLTLIRQEAEAGVGIDTGGLTIAADNQLIGLAVHTAWERDRKKGWRQDEATITPG